MAFELFRNKRPAFRAKVRWPRVCEVNDKRFVVYMSAELRAGKIGMLFSKDFYLPTLRAIRSYV